MATDELCVELDMEKRNVKRAVRQLVRAGLVSLEPGGGRQPVPRGHEGKANTYQLGPRVSPSIEGAIKGVTVDTLPTQTRVSVVTPNLPLSKLNNGVMADTPPLRGTSYPSGGSGERTAALTGGPTPSDLRPATNQAHRLRDLLRRFSPSSEAST